MVADEVVEPRRFIRYLRQTLHLSAREIQLPRRGVIVFGSEDFESFRKALGGKRASWSSWEFTGRSGRQSVFVGRSQIGAPAAAILVEEMGARGVRDFVVFGACGSLERGMPIGTVVIPTFAYPDEGTSRHYGAPRRPQPDPAILRALRTACKRHDLACVEGGVWTTDAPYRESRKTARSLVRRGVVAVDMEASALYAVARYRRYRVGSLMVVSDELGGDGWNPGFSSPRFRRAKRKAIQVLVDSLSRPWP